MSRTLKLSFLAIASFTLAGADYYVQAKAAQQTFQSYGLESYKQNVTARVQEMQEPAEVDEQYAAATRDMNNVGRIKTQTQAEAERKREFEEVLPDVFEHLSSNRKNRKESGFQMPQVGKSRSQGGLSAKRIRLNP